jgi:hypothetical protein
MLSMSMISGSASKDDELSNTQQATLVVSSLMSMKENSNNSRVKRLNISNQQALCRVGGSSTPSL